MPLSIDASMVRQNSTVGLTYNSAISTMRIRLFHHAKLRRDGQSYASVALMSFQRNSGLRHSKHRNRQGPQPTPRDIAYHMPIF